MRTRHTQGLQLTVLATVLLAAAGCGDDIRGSLNDVLDRTEEEVEEAYRTYEMELDAWANELSKLPRCRGAYPLDFFRMPSRDNFETDEEYHDASEQCQRRKLIEANVEAVRLMLRLRSTADWRQAIQNDRSAMEPMTEAELVNVAPRVRNLYGRWNVEAAETAGEQRRERLELDLEEFMGALRENEVR